MPRVEPAFSLYMKLILAFGLIFQMPTLVLFLARWAGHGAVPDQELQVRASSIMFIVGAVLSPAPPVGQIAMAGPMFLLYLFSIVLAWVFGKKRATATRSERSGESQRSSRSCAHQDAGGARPRWRGCA